MKKLSLIFLLSGMLVNVIAMAEVSKEKQIIKHESRPFFSSRTKHIFIFVLGAGTGIVGLRYFNSLFGNPRKADDKAKILQEKRSRGAIVAGQIGRLENNPLEYIAQSLADGRIGVIETNDEPDSTIRIKKFFLRVSDQYGTTYSPEALQSARKLMEAVEENLEAYNAYAYSTGLVPLIIHREYDKQNMLSTIGIKKSIKLTSDWVSK